MRENYVLIIYDYDDCPDAELSGVAWQEKEYRSLGPNYLLHNIIGNISQTLALFWFLMMMIMMMTTRNASAMISPDQAQASTRGYSLLGFEITTRTLLEKFYYSAE